MSEGMAIRIERFTWDSSKCRGNKPLISYQLYLLIPYGCDLTFPGTKLYKLWKGRESKHFWPIV